MDIRTKLVFALVAVALGSMLAFGTVMYGVVKDRMEISLHEQLESLADARQETMVRVISGWRERVRLIASRTQLRQSMESLGQSPDPETSARIERILTDAVQSAPTVVAIAAYDRSGVLVADAGEPADSTLAELEERAAPRWAGLPEVPGEVRFQGASFAGDGYPRVGFVANLGLDEEHVGHLYVILQARQLVALTESHRGETGELLIVKPDPDGGASTLHAVRHRPGERPGPVKLSGSDHPGLRALDQEVGLPVDGLVDYRGEPVWAATRYLEEVDWGLVVKIDKAEELEAIGQIRRTMTNLGLSLAAFAILIGVVLAVRFANPIHELAGTATKIREGDLRARSSVDSKDEVGLLARTFNVMADELEERMTLLREFKTFFDQSLDLLCIAGTDGYFKMTNPAFEQVLGWSKQELTSEPFMSLVHPDDAKATWEEIEKLSRGIPTISFVNRFRCSDGSYKYLRWTSHPDPETGLLYAVARETSRRPDA